MLLLSSLSVLSLVEHYPLHLPGLRSALGLTPAGIYRSQACWDVSDQQNRKTFLNCRKAEQRRRPT